MARALPLDEIPVWSKENPPNPDTDFLPASIFLINKFKDWSSFDAVKFLRSRIRIKKVGHAGTLDPMATGLLVICAGKATKSISMIQDMKKTYRAEITLGASTPSYDAETEPDVRADWEHVSLEQIKDTLKKHFSGEIQQVPPMYSALKAGGKRLYELARKGQEIERPPRSVTIHDYQIKDFEGPRLDIEICCSKGTYIRSIAHDLGILLGSRAHLTALERTSIGHFENEKAFTPHELGDILRDG